MEGRECFPHKQEGNWDLTPISRARNGSGKHKHKLVEAGGRPPCINSKVTVALFGLFLVSLDLRLFTQDENVRFTIPHRKCTVTHYQTFGHAL